MGCASQRQGRLQATCSGPGTFSAIAKDCLGKKHCGDSSEAWAVAKQICRIAWDQPPNPAPLGARHPNPERGRARPVAGGSAQPGARVESRGLDRDYSLVMVSSRFNKARETTV